MAVNIQVRMYDDNQLNQMMQSVIIKSSLFYFFLFYQYLYTYSFQQIFTKHYKEKKNQNKQP